MTPVEAARRLRVAEDELADAHAGGSTREVAAYAIAVEVLAQLAQRGPAQTD
ncbi:MAG TPA: hypothetical protein VH274_01240 [Mycobacteriales bacterium]|nr:hypothetical protein [Mycobacteriales bacterium]